MFERSIRIFSKVLAAIIIFVMADVVYLLQKGFVWQDGTFVLVKNAQAKGIEKPLAEIDTSSFSIEPLYVLGDKNAPITIYEFSSLGCTHCSDFHLDILPKLKKDFIDQGKVKLIFADFPIDKKSMQAAMVARCFPEDKYFDFLSFLFKKQMTWGFSFKTEKLLLDYAQINGLSKEKSLACLKDDKIAAEIMYVRQQAMEKLQIQATPSFLLRSNDGDELITGVPNYKALTEKLNKRINC
ncbi:MAG: DsbA family protein [Alphaproteobacteria bacterium]|nr:DsbA family protein [Alphaproteobacteria bacterium]